MNKKKIGAVFFALLMCGLATQVAAQGSEPKFNSNDDDLTKIRGLVEEFRQDIIHKDGYALTKLVLNPNVLFHHTNNQEEIDSARKHNDKVTNSGLEHWQVCKIDGQWKVLSVTWTSYDRN